MADFSGLFRALLWSVLFHAVLFWPQAAPSASGAASVLQARLRTAVQSSVLTTPASSVPVAQAEPAASPVRTATSAPLAPVVPAVAAARPPAATQALPERSEGADAGGLRQYRVGLAAWLARNPDWRMAMAGVAAGHAVVAVQLAGDGRPPQVALVRSDLGVAPTQQLLTAVQMAAEHTALPGVLQGQALVLHLPFEFER